MCVFSSAHPVEFGFREKPTLCGASNTVPRVEWARDFVNCPILHPIELKALGPWKSVGDPTEPSTSAPAYLSGVSLMAFVL